MCQPIRNPPLRKDDIRLIVETLPHQVDLANGVYGALNDALFPHWSVLPTIVSMKEHLDRQDFGLLRQFSAVRVPLSIVGQDNVRYRTPVVRELHDGFLPFAMAGRNCQMLDGVLADHGVALLRDCSCGLVMLPTEMLQRYEDSEVRRALNAYRSSLERMGAPVKNVTGWDEIPANMDITPAEERLFLMIEGFRSKIIEVRKWFIPEAFAKMHGIPEAKELLFDLAEETRDSLACA